MSTDSLVGPLVDARPARRPERQPIEGRYVTLAPIETSHAPALFERLCGAALLPETRSAIWRFLPGDREGFDTAEEFAAHVARLQESTDPFYYTVLAALDGEGEGDARTPVGYLGYLNIETGHRSLELGWVTFSPVLQRTRAATEAFCLATRHAIEGLGYRRVEWKCDALHARSRRAAARLGFQPEGVFRAHRIVRGRNRDTAWYAIIDDPDWRRGAVAAALDAWLDPANFRPEDGSQIRKLEDIREELRGAAAGGGSSGD